MGQEHRCTRVQAATSGTLGLQCGSLGLTVQAGLAGARDGAAALTRGLPAGEPPHARPGGGLQRGGRDQRQPGRHGRRPRALTRGLCAQESHCTPVQAMAFNTLHPQSAKLVATVGSPPSLVGLRP